MFAGPNVLYFVAEVELENLPEGVRLNDDAAMVAKLRQALAARGGYCPCRIQRIPDNVCICREFREQIADPEFEGFCHCRLYWKDRKNGTPSS